MKYAAFIMVFVLLASLVGVGYVYMTATVVVEATGVHVVEASAQPDTFADVQQQLRCGAVLGTSYTSTVPESIGDYQFVVYQVRLRNNCFLSAEMVEIQVAPREGDVLQLGSDLPAQNLEPHTAGIFETKILTDVNLYTTRELNITYYIWGYPFSIRTTIGN